MCRYFFLGLMLWWGGTPWGQNFGFRLDGGAALLASVRYRIPESQNRVAEWLVLRTATIRPFVL
jgi:hypothetical protein